MQVRLFRAKSSDTKKWVYGGYVPGYICSFDLNDDERIPVDDATVGQASNYYDSDNCLIFEGDILLAQNLQEKYWKVDFVNDKFVASLVSSDDDWLPLHEFLNSTYVKIVGNIHDNPEYLKM